MLPYSVKKLLLFEIPCSTCPPMPFYKDCWNHFSYVQNNDLECIFINGYGRRVFDIQNAKHAKSRSKRGSKAKFLT